MKKITRHLLGSALVLGLVVPLTAQQITTPAGSPLQVGNNGLRFNTIPTVGTATEALAVDGSGNVIRVALPAAGGSSQWTTSGNNINYGTVGNVGIGVTTPVQKLDVNGNVNLPLTGSLRLGNTNLISAPGDRNVHIGPLAGNSSTGAINVFVGSASGFSNTSGSYNIFMGELSGYSNTSGSSNFLLGYAAGYKNNGSGNVFMGTNAGRENTGGLNNVYIGNSAGRDGVNSSYNTFVGLGAGLVNSADYNMFMGGSSGSKNTSGSGNMFLGFASGFDNISSSNNIFVGKDCGLGTTSGLGGNVMIGVGSGGGNTTGDKITLIGTASNVIGNNLTNATAIGYNATVSASNSVVLGNSAANVGMGGVTNPTAKLEIGGQSGNNTGIKFRNLNSGGGLRVLAVNAAGEVVMANTTATREAAGFAENWKLDTDNNTLTNLNEGAVVIGKNISRVPKGYGLAVENGILTERVKVALKSTDDWSDKVFDTSYKLRSLGEVESFINKNGHLPGVPSAKEMLNNGNDLGKTDAVLLEKIEELTLYMLQMKKENAQLRKEVEQLKNTKN